jgi:tetratricopeptide (TPR) repeat protein
LETRPPEEQIAGAKAWLAERRALLVLDDIWENDVEALVPGPPISLLCTSRRHAFPWISRTHSLEVKSFSRYEAESIFRIYLGDETTEKHREALLDFAERVERLPIAIVVGADMLRRELDPVPEAARALRLERLRNEVHDVGALLRRAITARPEEQRRLLNAMAVCALEGFWFPLTVEIAGLTEAEGRGARNKLVDASLVRMLDRDRQRFQLHALLREELRNLAPLSELQAAHAVVLEKQFADWEGQWCECRECLPEVIPAVQHLWETSETSRAMRLTSLSFAAGRRIGELEIIFRIVQQEETLCLELNDKYGLVQTYGNQALVLLDWGRLEEAMALQKNVEALCLELGNKDGLQRSYGNQAVILRAWGRLEEALALLRKKEGLCLERGYKKSLQACYGNQALILHDWGQLQDALDLHKKCEALCLELDDKDGLQHCYGNQALVLQDWGRMEEAMVLHKKVEAICLKLGNKASLQISYGNQAAILRALGQLDAAMALHKKEEALCLKLSSKNSLQRSYGNQALILRDWGRPEEAMALLKKQEALCLELGNKNDLQTSYGNQAVILQTWGQLEQAMALHEKQEALCLELGIRRDLAYCYWQWGSLARKQRDLKTEREKLAAAHAIFVELNMPREGDKVRAELAKTVATNPGT